MDPNSWPHDSEIVPENESDPEDVEFERLIHKILSMILIEKPQVGGYFRYSEFALRFVETLLSRVRAPPPAT
ncbi:hypothetical protein PoB_000608800 [Plakobranchus ocellatus]|uniref:Uncharacterized protein n=1 Tax=Plakobranchus ocellatus TaxID=259542 RepID=A0AAV3YBQ5_9GAST|nr:hypothetical protein PoB_000608800 [Plakobranchus ocellatus]